MLADRRPLKRLDTLSGGSSARMRRSGWGVKPHNRRSHHEEEWQEEGREATGIGPGHPAPQAFTACAPQSDGDKVHEESDADHADHVATLHAPSTPVPLYLRQREDQIPANDGQAVLRGCSHDRGDYQRGAQASEREGVLE